MERIQIKLVRESGQRLTSSLPGEEAFIKWPIQHTLWLPAQIHPVAAKFHKVLDMEQQVARQSVVRALPVGVAIVAVCVANSVEYTARAHYSRP